jgi:cystathionine beta-lyase/cystathionine gamma-synthase
MPSSYGPSTRSIHAGGDGGEDVVAPLRRSVITRFDTAERFGRVMAGVEDGFLYGRIASPTVQATAAAIAELEGAESALLTASGMAAVHATIVALVPVGGRLVVARQVYGNSLSLFRDLIAARLAVDVRLVDVTDLDQVRAATRDGADVVYVETIANPGVAVADLDALAVIADTANARLVVDSTIATPLLCRPLDHGAAVVIHSATKFLNGHHDVLAGAVCADRDTIDRIRAILIDTGGVCDPDSAWLLRRGISTLALRLERQCANTLAIARALEGRDGVLSVPYPGLPSHPQHALAGRLLGGRYGAVLAVEVAGARAGGEAVMNHVRLIERSTSIGGLVTGISHPASTSHRQLSEDELVRAGVPAGLVRIAVGCEDADDLIGDLTQALAAAETAQRLAATSR